jgi:hypothetical protein
MMDPDVMTVVILLMVVVIAWLMPPGPGTPLPERVQSR